MENKAKHVHLTFMKKDIKNAHKLLKNHPLGDWLNNETFHLFIFDGDWEKEVDKIDEILGENNTYNECEVY
jgi:hypothetical protein